MEPNPLQDSTELEAHAGLVEGLAHDYGRELTHFIARRVRTASDAQDLAQETYVRLIRLQRKDLIREPRSYLYRVAINVLFDYAAARKAEVAALRWFGSSCDAERIIDDGMETEELRRQLETVIQELPPKCRAVLILHRQAGMTYEEIARTLKISSSMVKKHLAKGLRHCRGQLREWR